MKCRLTQRIIMKGHLQVILLEEISTQFLFHYQTMSLRQRKTCFSIMLNITLVIVLLNCQYHFINTPDYHLGLYEPSSPSTKVLHVISILGKWNCNSICQFNIESNCNTVFLVFYLFRQMKIAFVSSDKSLA